MEQVFLGLSKPLITYTSKTTSIGKNKNCTDNDGKVGNASQIAVSDVRKQPSLTQSFFHHFPDFYNWTTNFPPNNLSAVPNGDSAD
jgi:hypothetical protein